MASNYSKLTENTKQSIIDNARQDVENKRAAGLVVPLSFSSLDKEYSDKFHKILADLKQSDPKATKMATFKMLVDFYQSHQQGGENHD